MDHFQKSHEMLTSGIKKMFEDFERTHPEPENQGLLATLRETVHNFCESKVPKTHDELMQLTQAHRMALMAIENTASILRRQKLWDRKMN
jgi:hypothetical protein